MHEGLIIAASGGVKQQIKMDVLANNMANLNNAGFKADGLVFREIIPPFDNDLGYELHNIDGKDIIVKTRQVIKGIKCPKGYSMADSFFNYKGE